MDNWINIFVASLAFGTTSAIIGLWQMAKEQENDVQNPPH
jgi:hypothetical protein